MFSASSLITATRIAFWDVIRTHFCSFPLILFLLTLRSYAVLANQNKAFLHGSKFECEARNIDMRILFLSLISCIYFAIC